jgi:hypothetical protein
LGKIPNKNGPKLSVEWRVYMGKVVLMANRKPYERKLRGRLGWMLKATGLIIAGATVVTLVMAIGRGISVKPDAPQGGRFVGVRHDAVSLAQIANIEPDVSPPAEQGEESSTDTVVLNGVTVVSPQLLVPVIDLAAIQPASGSEPAASRSKVVTARKRSHVAKRSRSQPETRIARTHWSAYGLALR